MNINKYEKQEVRFSNFLLSVPSYLKENHSATCHLHLHSLVTAYLFIFVQVLFVLVIYTYIFVNMFYSK